LPQAIQRLVPSAATLVHGYSFQGTGLRGMAPFPRGGVDPASPVRYVFPSALHSFSMKSFSLKRVVLSFAVAVVALWVSGCGSSGTTIAPNWYDSAFYKNGSLDTSPNNYSAPVPEPGSR